MRTILLGELLRGFRLSPDAFVGCSPQTEIHGLCVDSRSVTRGCAFLATQGATHDAHRFVAHALQAGATAVLIKRGHVDAPRGPHVWLDNPDLAYPVLAERAMGSPAKQLTMAAVTGTNGKTTVTHLLTSVLQAAGLKTTRLGTTGNWVVDRAQPSRFTTPFPLELQRLLRTTVDRSGTHVVMEASSHALAQGRVQPLLFHAVGFTSFSQDHLDFHASMADYLAAKCKLAAEHLRPGGVAVAVTDGSAAAEAFLRAAGNARTVRVSRGSDPHADIVAESVDCRPDTTIAQLRTPHGIAQLRTPLIAPFNLDNALVTLGIALELGVPLDEALAALTNAQGAPGRLQRITATSPSSTHPIVLVDYAHTPDAVARALEAVRPLCRGKLHIVLGCGGDRDASKRSPMGRAAALGSDHFWATSDNPRSEPPAAIVDDMLRGLDNAPATITSVVDRAKAIAQAIANAESGDLVLIAGKGHETMQIVGERVLPFDDSEHARAALDAR